MDTKQKKLNDIDKSNPFKTPDGYFEQLTSNIMDQLPETVPAPVVRVTLMDRVKPWLYMAAVFAGLGLFFKTLVGSDFTALQSEPQSMESSIVKLDEEEVYWDYLESMYADDMLLEELEKSE